MCGIMGYLKLKDGKFDSKFKNRITEVLVRSEARGKEATGFAYPMPGKENPEELSALYYYKDDKKASEFVKLDPWQKLELPQILIAHTRLSTQGKPENNMNNHPIVGHESVLVHNGKLINDFSLFRDYNLERTGEVDSEVILRLLEKFVKEGLQVEEAIKKMCSIVSGEYACAYMHTSRPGELFLFRHGRPLELGYIKDLGVVVFASERKFIEDSFIKYNWHLGFFIERVPSNTIIYRELMNDYALTLRLDGANDLWGFEPYKYTTGAHSGNGYWANGVFHPYKNNTTTTPANNTNACPGTTNQNTTNAAAAGSGNKGSEDVSKGGLLPGQKPAEQWFRDTYVRVYTCPSCKSMDELRNLNKSKYYCPHCNFSLLNHSLEALNADSMLRSEWDAMISIIGENEKDKIGGGNTTK